MRSFLQELRRRNVYKVGVMYAVGGWLLVQVATSVLPLFEVSPLTLRLVVLVIAAGFPIALVLSWVYEVTPEGIVKTSEVAPHESIAHHTGQRLNYVIIGVLALAVVFLLAQRWWLPRKADQAVAAISDKSVAVLPFANLSEEKANASMHDPATPSRVKAASEAGFELTREESSNFFRMPAEFLIDTQGVIQQAFYSDIVGVHLPFADIEAYLAASVRS